MAGEAPGSPQVSQESTHKSKVFAKWNPHFTKEPLFIFKGKIKGQQGNELSAARISSNYSGISCQLLQLLEFIVKVVSSTIKTSLIVLAFYIVRDLGSERTS